MRCIASELIVFTLCLILVDILRLCLTGFGPNIAHIISIKLFKESPKARQLKKPMFEHKTIYTFGNSRTLTEFAFNEIITI